MLKFKTRINFLGILESHYINFYVLNILTFSDTTWRCLRKGGNIEELSFTLSFLNDQFNVLIAKRTKFERALKKLQSNIKNNLFMSSLNQ